MLPRRRSRQRDRDAVSMLDRQVVHRFSRFSAAYRSRLLKGLQDLQTYCTDVIGCQMLTALNQPRAADKLLGQYVMDRHSDKSLVHRSVVKHALLGCQHLVPALRRQLHSAWENMRVWEEQVSTRLRPPIPIPLWCLMIGLARAHGWATHNLELRRTWFVFSVMLELGVLCLLRPGELCRLRHSDFALPGDLSVGRVNTAVRIISPKNRRQFGEQQFVTMMHPNVVLWLRMILNEGQDAPLWPGKPALFSKFFKQLVKELGIEGFKFTPASLRPGGATMFYTMGIPIALLRFLGRWTVERSLEHYIQQATATQILNRLSEQVVARLLKLSSKCLDMIAHPQFRVLLPWLPKQRKLQGPAVVGWCSRYADFGRQTW